MHGNIMAGAAFIRLTLNDASLNDGLERAKKNVETFSQRAKVAFLNMSVLGDKAFNGFLTMAFPVGTAIREFSRFDDSLRSLQAISGANETAMNGLTKQIRHLGATTAFTASQVADGGVELARMGLSAEELKDAMPAALNLVRATGTETFRLGEVAEFAAASMRIFNLESNQFSDITDVMAYAANRSAMNIADLGEAMKIAGPSANTVGENIRDTAAALMLFANAGIKGSLAGTSLRKIYQSLAAVSGQTEGWTPAELDEGLRGEKQLQEMGIRVVDDNGNLRKSFDIMQDLAAAVKKMKSGEKINFATDVFDLRGSLGALSMLSNPADLKRFREELNNVGNYAEKTAKKIEDGTGGQLRRFKSALEELMLSFGEFMANSLMPFIKGLTNFSLVMSDVVQSFGGVGKFFIQLTGGATAGGLALWALTQAMRAVGSGFAPLIAGIKYLDSYASGAKKAAAAAEALSNAQMIADRNKSDIDKAKSLVDQKNKRVDDLQAELALRQAKAQTANQEMVQEKALLDIKRQQYLVAEQEGGASLKSAQKELALQEKIYNKKVKAAAAASGNVTNTRNTLTNATAAQIEAQKVYGDVVNRETTAEKVLLAAQRKRVNAAKSLIHYVNKSNKLGFRAGNLSLRQAKLVRALSLAQLRAGGASTFMAMRLKLAAGATMALNKALAFIAAHPVLVGIMALVGAVKLMNWAFSRATENAKKMSEAAKKASEASAARTSKNDTKRQDATFAFKRLQELEKLSQTSKLSADEITEAVDLINSLRPFGSNEWANIDKVTGKINLASDAMQRLQKSMREAAIADIQSEMKKLNSEELALKRVMKNIAGEKWSNNQGAAYWTNMFSNYWVSNDEAEQMKEYANDLESVVLKRIALEKRLQAITGGDKNAVVGKELSMQNRANANREKRNLSEKEYQDILKKQASLEEDLDRKSRSAYENQIHDIKKTRDEHLKLLEQLKAEAKLRNKNADVKMYDKNIASIQARYQKQLDDAKKAEEKRIADSWGNSKTAFEDIKKKNNFDDKRQQQDMAIEGLLKNNAFDEAIQVLNKFVTAEKNIFANLEKEYDKKVKEFESPTSLGGTALDAEEKKQLDALRSAGEAANSRGRAWQDQIRQITKQAADFQATDNTRVVGGFSAAVISRALYGSGGSDAKRTADASEKTNRLLTDLKRLASKQSDYEEVYTD